MGRRPFQALYKVVIPQIIRESSPDLCFLLPCLWMIILLPLIRNRRPLIPSVTYVVNATRGAQTEIKTALWALSTVIFLVVILAVAVMNLAASRQTKRQEVSTYDSKEKN